MVDKSKTSSSAQPTAAPLVTVVGSELDIVANSNYLAYLLPNVAAARLVGQQSDSNLGGSEEEEEEEEDDTEIEDPLLPGQEDGNLRPSLSDIEVVSNTVSMSSAGLSSATVVFKVKNSSGQVLKSINVRVEKK